jgi:phosphoenolpyruvate synthase/pyruvate phosphate dikinase
LLAVNEYRPQDREVLHWSRGAIAATGGKASHLSLACRAWGKPCIVGLDAISINDQRRELKFADQTYPEFMAIMIDGTTGTLFLTTDIRSKRVEHSVCADNLSRLRQVVQRTSGSPELHKRTLAEQELVAETIYFLGLLEQSR